MPSSEDAVEFTVALTSRERKVILLALPRESMTGQPIAAVEKLRAALTAAAKASPVIPVREVEQLRDDLRRCRAAHAVPVILPDAVSPFVLKQHYLAGIECDHERKMDNPRCACSLVFLGWHPSVGEAVDAWIEHVMEVARS
jgi:hypothetical protein